MIIGLKVIDYENYDNQKVITSGQSAVQVPSSAASTTKVEMDSCYIWRLSSNVRIPVTNSRPFNISTPISFIAKAVKQGTGLQPLSDTFTATAAQTIANENIGVGQIGSTGKYLYPSIVCYPITATARTLIKTEYPAIFPNTGGIRQTITATTAATDKFVYVVGAWTIRSDQQS